MQVAAYSGSFNPLHIGHLAILRSLTAMKDFDMTYLIVSPKNPLKSGIDPSSAAKRFEEAQEALSRHPELRAKADDIELHMPSPQYTIRTLDALARREPENRFTLVIGADSLASFRQWRDYRRILIDYGIAVYPRRGYDLKALGRDLMAENQLYRIREIDAPEVDVSSTEVRQMERLGEDVTPLLM